MRNSTSTSPVARTEKRSAAVVPTNSTASASPNTAAATARQKSASNPLKEPSSCGSAKPIALVETPHRRAPRACTSARVPPWVRVTVTSGAAVVEGSAAVVVVSPSPPQALITIANVKNGSMSLLVMCRDLSLVGYLVLETSAFLGCFASWAGA